MKPLDKYQIYQKSTRTWRLCRLQHRTWTSDLDFVIAVPFGMTYYRLDAALAQLRILREGPNYLEQDVAGASKEVK